MFTVARDGTIEVLFVSPRALLCIMTQPQISIEPTDDPIVFTVRLALEDGSETTHTVTAKPYYLHTLGLGECDPKDVIHKAFTFLLEREPIEEILPQFALSNIARYFPEFSTEMRSWNGIG